MFVRFMSLRLRSYSPASSAAVRILLPFTPRQKQYSMFIIPTLTFTNQLLFASPGRYLDPCQLSHSTNTIYSGVVFARKQDAVRHVKTMNDGKKFVCICWSVILTVLFVHEVICCSISQKSYSRKDYRDSHQERCFDRNSSYTFRV
jgi:hypothetical protein